MNRSNQEKRREIAAMLKSMSDRSNKWIADQLGVSDNTVRSERKKLEEQGELPPRSVRIGGDGKLRPVATIRTYNTVPKWLLDRLHEREPSDEFDCVDRPQLGNPIDYHDGITGARDHTTAALLLPLLFLRLGPENPQDALFSRLKSVYVIRRPLDFKDQEWRSYAWFVWDNDSEGSPTILSWID